MRDGTGWRVSLTGANMSSSRQQSLSVCLLHPLPFILFHFSTPPLFSSSSSECSSFSYLLAAVRVIRPFALCWRERCWEREGEREVEKTVANTAQTGREAHCLSWPGPSLRSWVFPTFGIALRSRVFLGRKDDEITGMDKDHAFLSERMARVAWIVVHVIVSFLV